MDERRSTLICSLPRREWTCERFRDGRRNRIDGRVPVQTLRNACVNFRDHRSWCRARNEQHRRNRSAIPLGRSLDDAVKAAAGEALVSDNLARLQQLSLGDTEVPALRLLRLPIVGIVLDYSDQQGAARRPHGLRAPLA
jgi:hypothetical protein